MSRKGNISKYSKQKKNICNQATKDHATFYLRHTVSLTVMHDHRMYRVFPRCSSRASPRSIRSLLSLFVSRLCTKASKEENATQHANTAFHTHPAHHQLNPNSSTKQRCKPKPQSIFRSSLSSRWISVASGSSTSSRSSTSNWGVAW